jgi:maleate cis-trans isomerase
MKKYIGMAWPSDGLNDSEYWQLIPRNIELLIARYPVSGSLNLKDLKKEANLSNIYKVIKKLHAKKLNSLILCDFASSVLNDNYISNSELFFKTKLNIPCLNIVSSTIKFISNRKKKITIISPYSKNITKKFINLLPNTHNINSVKSLSLNSEVDISNIYKELKNLSLKKSDGDLIFIGGGVTITNFKKEIEHSLNIKIYSSPLLIIKDAIKVIN